MHAEINVRFEISIDEQKELSLATLAEFITDQQVESLLLESIVESLDASCVEALCGEKHAHGNGNKRFQRAATKTRSAVTTAGDHEFSLTYVEDSLADPDEDTYFRPVEDIIDFDGQNQYQPDIVAKGVEFATDLSYRNAATHGDGIFERMPSPTTINERVIEYGSKLKDALPEFITDTDADAVLADATKCHSQEDDRSFNHVRATLEEDTDENSHTLLDLSVDTAWNEIAADLDELDAVTDDATVVSDGDSGLTTAFTDTKRTHQLDLVHVGRTLGHRLLMDDIFPLETRKEIVSEVVDEVFHLKNSVLKHRPEEEFEGIRERIAHTRERISKTAWQLEQLGSEKAAGYLRRWLPSITTFAEAALDGFEVPWTSNPVKRAMGEIAKRCKNQGMSWTRAGLEALLQLRLVRYANPDHYREFFDELLDRSTKTAMTCEVTMKGTRGEV